MAWWTSRILLCAIDLALTLFSYYMLDYTLNRITLFALFVVGFVDDRYHRGEHAQTFQDETIAV
jgi:multidrug efflux pump subunit AcrB